MGVYSNYINRGTTIAESYDSFESEVSNFSSIMESLSILTENGIIVTEAINLKAVGEKIKGFIRNLIKKISSIIEFIENKVLDAMSKIVAKFKRKKEPLADVVAKATEAANESYLFESSLASESLNVKFDFNKFVSLNDVYSKFNKINNGINSYESIVKSLGINGSSTVSVEDFTSKFGDTSKFTSEYNSTISKVKDDKKRLTKMKADLQLDLAEIERNSRDGYTSDNVYSLNDLFNTIGIVDREDSSNEHSRLSSSLKEVTLKLSNAEKFYRDIVTFGINVFNVDTSIRNKAEKLIK